MKLSLLQNSLTCCVDAAPVEAFARSDLRTGPARGHGFVFFMVWPFSEDILPCGTATSGSKQPTRTGATQCRNRIN